MTTLDLKLIRDLRGLKSQAFAVALVIACGLAMLILTRSLLHSLETARDSYYREYHFADVFARLKRAPNAVALDLAAIPGVSAVETGITIQATLDLPGVAEPAVGTLRSLPERGQLKLNQLYIREGEIPDASAAPGDVVVSEPFAEANNLHPGDTISAVIYGRRQELRVRAVALSPEYVFESPPGAALPDHKTYGVFWMPYKELATAGSLYNAFNNVSLSLAPGASESTVIAAVDRILTPYGGRGAYGRDMHASHTRVRDEMKVLGVLSVGFPLIFLSIAAFITNAVMSRQITLQREQIAVLKAFGVTNRAIGWHYFKFSLAIVFCGTALGIVGGILLGGRFVEMYHLFFRFPQLDFTLATGTLGAAVIVSALAALAGVALAVRTAVRLPPAEAMRPEAPAKFRPALAERLGFGQAFSPILRMALRNIERHPVRACLSAFALALATGILIVPNALRDGITFVLDYQWDTLQRQSVFLSLIEPGPSRSLSDLAHLPGVTVIEPLRYAPVEMRSGTRMRRLVISGFPAHAELNRVVDTEGHRLTLSSDGLVISSILAGILGVKPGDQLELRFLDGERRTVSVPLVGVAADFAGTAAFMDIDGLNRIVGDGDRISGAAIRVAGGKWDEFLRAVKDTPFVASVLVKDTIRNSFRDTTGQSIGLLQKIYMTFAVVIAFGIVYNSARISLSERQRELATLRVVGFTQSEVAGVLISELFILTAIALPTGLLLGTGFATVLIGAVNTEFIRLPLVLTSSNYAFALLVVSVASLGSALLAARRLNRLDLVGALKAAE